MAEDPRSARPDHVDPVRLAHFRILGRLGRGGMGIVYRAEDEKLQRVVALKVLPPAFEEDRDRRARFLREARAAAAVSHPNIASVHEIGESDGRVFIAMELVEGRTLRAMLASGPIAVADAVRIATQIARGLAKAHQAHIVHRDLKPDNVIVGEDLHTKILDFGLAKVTSSEPAETPSALERLETATREGMLVGTPQYMSPEQAKGRALDATSDIFSFGIVLYEMVTGRRPFEGPSVTEIIIAIDRDAPRPVFDANPLVPAQLVRVIDRCLEKDPARRYPDGRALADDLASLRLDAQSSPPVSLRGPAPAPAPAAAPIASAVVTAPALSPVGPFLPPSPSFVTPSPAHMPVRPKRTRRWWAIIAVLAVFAGMRTLKCAGGAGGGGSGGNGKGKGVAALPPQAAQAMSALAAAASALQGGLKLACPPLLASGVEEPSGWLGAAAANVTCRRAAIVMGGRLDHVMVPAELLDLPRQPTDDFPRDPYGAPGARDRAVAAAKERAAAWLDGTVEKKGDGFHVRLVVREPDGDEVESGEGTGHHVYLAVADAMRRLVKEDAIEKADAIDPEIAKWSGVKDVDLALELEDWHDSLGSSPVSTQTALAKLREHKAELGPLWPHIQSESQMPMLVENDTYDPVSLDRSSPPAFAISAVSYAETVPDANRTALAAEAAKLRDVEPSRQGRHALLMAQAEILVSGGQMVPALELALGELREEPRSDHTWEIPLLTLQGQPNLGPVARAFAAWMPEDHASWNAISTSDVGLKDMAARLAFARRAYDLSPDFPIFGDTLGKQLVQAGRPEDARAIATSMLTVGSFMDPAAQGILVLVDATEAHFGAAVQRGASALGRVDRFGVQIGDWYLIDALTGAGAVAQGTSAAVGDDFAKRFVLVDPPRLGHGVYFGGPLVLAASDACLMASRDVAKRCFSRLRQLLAAGYFPEAEPTTSAYIDGCDHYAQGDLRGATSAWRPLIAGHAADAGYAGNAVARFGPLAFDAAGEHELAAKLDAQSVISGFGNFAGASLAQAREARRALARGDRERARELAQKIVDAWGASDVPVPAVDDMRALLAKTTK